MAILRGLERRRRLKSFEGVPTTHMYTNDLFLGWGWILWFGFIFLLFSSVGNWGYAYRAHHKFDGSSQKDASVILNERYARSDLTRAQYL